MDFKKGSWYEWVGTRSGPNYYQNCAYLAIDSECIRNTKGETQKIAEHVRSHEFKEIGRKELPGNLKVWVCEGDPCGEGLGCHMVYTDGSGNWRTTTRCPVFTSYGANWRLRDGS